MLPPKHQHKLIEITDRVRAYRQMREIIGGTPDTVPPHSMKIGTGQHS